jgi:hypothetical protein
MMPTKNDLALEQLLGYEHLSGEGKLAYSNSTSQRLAHIVAVSRSTKRGFGVVHSHHDSSLSVRNATVQLCRPVKCGNAILLSNFK